MEEQRFSTFKRLVLIVVALFWCIGQAAAEENSYALKRQEANERLQEAIEARQKLDPGFASKLPQQLQETAPTAVAATLAVPGPYPSGLGFNTAVHYNDPNYANSPNLRKFVDSLPGLGLANANSLGQYIPVANPDTSSYPGSDYYEIGLAQYNQQMHRDLPVAGTKLRGYYQINAGTVGSTDHAKQYLGPLIIANRDRAVRLKFTNLLGINGAGDLPLPVDMTVMGAGMGPITGQNYTQNRADIHLHGGLTPWISDGTPHQWVTPAGDNTSYTKGVSFQNVPDMVNGSVVNGSPVPCIGGAKCFAPTAIDGIGTYYSIPTSRAPA